MKPLNNKINLLNLDIQGIVKMEIIGMSLLLFLAGWFAWETSVMISEKKARQKAGTHDYYDNLIVKNEEGNDLR